MLPLRQNRGSIRRVSQLEQTTSRYRILISDDVRYLTIGQVKRRYGGVSDMWVWRYMREHGFPKPVQFGDPTSARHWLIADLEQWERERSKSPPQTRRDAHS